LIQKAHRARVVIVSPSLLMLSIQVIQAVLRDAKMREQAHLIQAEVGHLIADVGRLNDRVGKLQSHFAQANKDIDQILDLVRKDRKTQPKIEDLELGEASSGADAQGDDAPQLAIAPDR
jgi:DNA recombination protein RmuC